MQCKRSTEEQLPPWQIEQVIDIMKLFYLQALVGLGFPYIKGIGFRPNQYFFWSPTDYYWAFLLSWPSEETSLDIVPDGPMHEYSF